MSENDDHLVIATILRGDGITGVDTHIRQVRRYLDEQGAPCTLLTPFDWARSLTYPVFGIRSLLMRPLNRPAAVAWYLHWHEAFLRNALRRHLGRAGSCVVYAQDPLAARAALRTRRDPQQRVVMAVHLRISMADEWADKKQIKPGGTVYRAIRRMERETIPHVDGLVYVSRWGRDALLDWLPEAAAVPSAVIGNFVTAPCREPSAETGPLGDLVTVGNLDLVKNHRFLLDVLAEATRAGRLITLDIFGDGPCRKDLIKQANDLGLSHQVRFRGFQRGARDLLPRYLAYVHASYSESLPLAIIEAMAAGLPVVAAGTGGIPELCDDGVEARFWSLNDPAGAATTLLRLLDREEDRLKAAKAAAERFRRDFDAGVIGPRLRSFLFGPVPLAARRPPPSERPFSPELSLSFSREWPILTVRTVRMGHSREGVGGR